MLEVDKYSDERDIYLHNGCMGIRQAPGIIIINCAYIYYHGRKLCTYPQHLCSIVF